jgi:hypothetical protein
MVGDSTNHGGKVISGSPLHDLEYFILAYHSRIFP